MMRCRNERESSRCTFLRNLASHSEMLSLAIFNIILVQWAFGILWQKAQIRGVQMFLWQFDIREIEFAGLVSVDQKNINNFINLIYYLLLLLLSHFSCVQPLATPWTAAYQAPLSMGVSRQEYWSGVPLPSLIYYLLLLLSRFSHVWLCANPETAAYQAPPSLGFSRQEHWSGLPFPSPMHESEKWKWSHSVVSNSEWSHGLQPTRLLHSWDFPGKSTGVGCHCLLQIYYLGEGKSL